MIKRIGFHFLALAVFAFSLGAAPSLECPVSIDIGAAADVFFCEDPSLGITEISGPDFASRFEPVAGRMIWTGAKAPATWLRFYVPGDGQAGQPHILAVKPSFSIILDHVALYVPRGDGGFDELRSGALEAPRPGEPASRSFLFELPKEAFSGKPAYLLLSSGTDVKVDVSLEKLTVIARRDSVDHLLFGILYGTILAMVVYGLFIFITLRDRAYLYYILYTVAAGIWLFFVQGHAKLVFGQHPDFDQGALWFFAGSLITWGAAFASEFLKLKDSGRFLNPLFLLMGWLGALVSVAGLAGWFKLAFALSHGLGVVVPVFAMVAAVIRIVQGYSSATYFLIGWFLMAAGSLAFSLMGLKLLPLTFLTTNGMAIGISAESLFFAIALADRFRKMEAESKRLKAIQDHYRDLSLKDPLTNLYNKRYLDMKLESAFRNAEENRAELSILVIDVDNLKEINDGFGHDRGDDVLKTLAVTLRNCVREGDDLCRTGGDEFVVLLPGIGTAGAGRVAERIRSRFALDSFSEKDGLNPTISLGVAEHVPGDSPDSFLKRADEALYEAKRKGKDRVMS
ncbi:MAG TPA: diguanylate cyclase [Rectinemataceae bacterium]